MTNLMLQISRFLFTARIDKGNLFWYYIFARLNLVFIFTELRKNMSVFFEKQTARKGVFILLDAQDNLATARN